MGNALAYAYQYDQLNRLITKTSWKGLDTAVNRWTPVALPDYKESLRYDANGNILTNNRYGNAHKGQMDQLTYYYKTGTNQLRHVKDAIAAAGYSTDIDDQQPDNYSYDAIGNLIADKSERIDTISWTVYGKIAGIKKRNGTIRYKYDAAGNRVYKQSVLDGKTNTSFYVRDAQGNVLGVYDLNEKGLSWEEQHLYGSSRLGVYRYGATMPLQSVTTRSASAVLQDSMTWGSRVYELSNHLGNVLATVSDKKLQVAGTGNTVAYYRAETLSANDYFAFGSLIEDRSFAVGNGYRYGFNGKENDNEVKGNGNQQDYGMRIYDPRIAKFLSVDPLQKQYPELTPYQFASNRPIDGIDQDGLEFMKYNDSYIRMQISYNAQLKKVDASVNFRVDETRKSSFLGLTLKVLPLRLEEKIKSIPINCNCIPGYDNRVASLSMSPSPEVPKMDDATSSFTKTSDFATMRIPKNIKELREIEKSRDYYTQGNSSSNSKWDARIAAIQLAGAILEKLGESSLRDIVNEAQGIQTQKAIRVLNIIGTGISSGAIEKKYTDNYSLSRIGNFLLYGKQIEDAKLQGVAKTLWTDYETKQKKK